MFSAEKNKYRSKSNSLMLGMKAGFFALTMFFLSLVPASIDNTAFAICVPVCNPGSCVDTCGTFTCAGNACSDGNDCTSPDTCNGLGACVAGAPTAVGSPCSDGNACTNPDTCNGAGSCAAGAPTVCNPDSCAGLIRTYNGVCNPGTGLCAYSTQNCDDSDTCTTDSCVPAACSNIWVAPTCNSLTAAPSEPIRNQGVTYTASSNCATSATVSVLGAIPPNGSIGPFPYNPPAGVYENTYWLSLSNPDANTPNACSVTVKLKPQCTLKCREWNTGAFSSPCSIAMGQDADLEWTTLDWDDGTPLMITTPVPDSWDVSGSTPSPSAVFPYDTPPTSAIRLDTFVNPPITYTMTLQSGSGVTNTCTAGMGKLPSCTITAAPPKLIQGFLPPQQTTITWSTYDATGGVWTSGFGGGVAPLAGGSSTVTPAVTTTYKMNVTNAFGTGTCETIVEVTPGIIPTCTLDPSPNTITVGMGTTLIWTGTNAASASINNGVGIVAPAIGGTVLAYPTSNTSYTMTVTSTTGHTNTCSSALVTVNPLPPVPVGGDRMYLKEFNKSANLVFHDAAKSLLYFVGGIALLVFVMSGMFLMISRGVPENRTKAKKMLLYAIIGLIIVILSYSLLVVVEEVAT